MVENKLILTPVMKNVLKMLQEGGPKKDTELFEIPTFSFELLGKLRDLEAIDHHGHLVYITSIGEKLLKEGQL